MEIYGHPRVVTERGGFAFFKSKRDKRVIDWF